MKTCIIFIISLLIFTSCQESASSLVARIENIPEGMEDKVQVTIRGKDEIIFDRNLVESFITVSPIKEGVYEIRAMLTDGGQRLMYGVSSFAVNKGSTAVNLPLFPLKQETYISIIAGNDTKEISYQVLSEDGCITEGRSENSGEIIRLDMPLLSEGEYSIKVSSFDRHGFLLKSVEKNISIRFGHLNSFYIILDKDAEEEGIRIENNYSAPLDCRIKIKNLEEEMTLILEAIVPGEDEFECLWYENGSFMHEGKYHKIHLKKKIGRIDLVVFSEKEGSLSSSTLLPL
ncbi:MAG TPA: hypothetical protein IAB12_00715 [Candidatus Ornithospirochaeta avicola]|uniref:Ig-like domain-containing protein n=1 Tax=Candidatus Ornithospirochaeta avicola TaxID=2840896 RepID=A0A9D1PRE6_9SPIO|nr:hypothetical protein [Candidatus Ornithospirochaeta avicola]